MPWEIPTDQQLSHWNSTNASDTASATTLTLPAYGTLIPITGNTTIQGITIPSGLPTQVGYDVDLLLPANITVAHLSGAPGAGAVAIRLASAANLATTQATILSLHYDGTYWSERSSGTFFVPPLVGPSGATAALANYWLLSIGGTPVGYIPLMASAGTQLGAAPTGSAGGDLAGSTYPDPVVANDKITYAKMQNVSAASKLIGRGDSGAGDPEEVTVGSGLTMTGTTLTATAGFVPSGTGFRHVTAGVEDAASKLVDTADINADQVTFAKIQNIATDSLAGRDTAGTGDLETIAVGGGIEFTGAGAIRTGAFTGDVTKAAGGTALTLAVAPFAVIQTSLGTASGTVDFNGQQATSSAAPSTANSFTNKAYVDSVASGLDPKGNARALSDSNIAALSGLATTIDGVAINTDGYRVLLIAQSTATQNGFWVAHAGAWTRPTDFAAGASAAGAYAFIEQGAVYAALGFICTNAGGSDIVDTDNLTFQQFSGAGQVNAGTGMTKSGNTLNVIANADGSIIANADDIQVGVLATNAQHGNRAGGALHATFVQSGASHATGFVPDPGASAGTTKFLREDATWVVPTGGSTPVWTDFIQDIGKGYSGTFDITGLSGLTTDKNVTIVQTLQIIPTKGNARDEFEFDAIQLTGYVVSATTIRARWWAPGIVVGDYAFAHMVGG